MAKKDLVKIVHRGGQSTSTQRQVAANENTQADLPAVISATVAATLTAMGLAPRGANSAPTSDPATKAAIDAQIAEEDEKRNLPKPAGEKKVTPASAKKTPTTDEDKPDGLF